MLGGPECWVSSTKFLIFDIYCTNSSLETYSGSYGAFISCLWFLRMYEIYSRFFSIAVILFYIVIDLVGSSTTSISFTTVSWINFSCFIGFLALMVSVASFELISMLEGFFIYFLKSARLSQYSETFPNSVSDFI